MKFLKSLLIPGYNAEIEAIARSNNLLHIERCKAIASIIGTIYEKDRKAGLDCANWFNRFSRDELLWEKAQNIDYILFFQSICMKFECCITETYDGKLGVNVNTDSIGKYSHPQDAEIVTTLQPNGTRIHQLRQKNRSGF
jgi:hypothetical protein